MENRRADRFATSEVRRYPFALLEAHAGKSVLKRGANSQSASPAFTSRVGSLNACADCNCTLASALEPLSDANRRKQNLFLRVHPGIAELRRLFYLRPPISGTCLSHSCSI
jgi:hypothetical protein